MAELADALDLGSSGETRAGSSPVIRRNEDNPNLFPEKKSSDYFLIGRMFVCVMRSEADIYSDFSLGKEHLHETG